MIFNKKKQPIKTLDEWSREVPSKDWVVGRSAYTLADFIINKKGLEVIQNTLKKVLKDEIVFNEAIPEYEVKFDKFPGRGRFHDLAIFGETKTAGKSIFIGVESKVDESFGQTISDAYISAIVKRLNGENTNAPERIETLLKQNFGNNIKNKHFDLRYQFLYSTIGSLKEQYDISIFFIIVFKTTSYDNLKGNENYRDYCQFIQSVISEKIPSNIDCVEVHKLTIENRELLSIFYEIEF